MSHPTYTQKMQNVHFIIILRIEKCLVVEKIRLIHTYTYMSVYEYPYACIEFIQLEEKKMIALGD